MHTFAQTNIQLVNQLYRERYPVAGLGPSLRRSKRRLKLNLCRLCVGQPNGMGPSCWRPSPTNG